MKKRLLLLDDEKHITMTLGSILRFNDFEVDVINTPDDLLGSLKSNPYDLLVIDLMMDPIDGFKACQLIRDDKDFEELKILALSAKWLTQEETKDLLTLNVHFMQKPFVPNTLIEKIQEIVQ